MSALGHKQTFAVQKGMSALPPKADMCSATRYVRFVPIADIIHRASQIEDRLAAVSPKSDLVFDHAASAAAFFFLRQPSRPNAPRPVANRGSAPGSGVASGVSVRNVSVEPLLNPQGPK